MDLKKQNKLSKESTQDFSVLTESQLEVYEYYEKFLLCSHYEDIMDSNEDSGMLSMPRVKILLQKLIQMKYITGASAVNALKHINFQTNFDQSLAERVSQDIKRISFEEFLSFLKVHGIQKIDQQEKHIEALESAWDLFDSDYIEKQELIPIMESALKRASGISKDILYEDKEWNNLWEYFLKYAHFNSKERINENEWKELWNKLMGVENNYSNNENNDINKNAESDTSKKKSIWRSISRSQLSNDKAASHE